MRDEHSIPMEYAALIAEQLRGMGVEEKDWLPRSGMTRAELAEPNRLLGQCL